MFRNVFMLLTYARSSSSVVWCLGNFSVGISVLGLKKWMWLVFYRYRMRQATHALQLPIV